MTVLPYHKERHGEVYSLTFANTDRSEVEQTAAQADAAWFIETVKPTDTPISVLYTTPDTEPVTAPIHHAADDPLVDICLSVYEGIVDDSNVDAAKDFAPNRLARAAEQIQWQTPVCDVAGQIVARFTQTHGLPNANHRSSIGLAAAYLTTQDEDIDFVSWLADPDAIPPETLNKTITESKRLLTLRRNCGVFQRLARVGVDGVERKGGEAIRFEDYDINLSDPYTEYRERQMGLWETFFTNCVCANLLRDPSHIVDTGRSVFLDRVAAGHVDPVSVGRAVARFRD